MQRFTKQVLRTFCIFFIPREPFLFKKYVKNVMITATVINPDIEIILSHILSTHFGISQCSICRSKDLSSTKHQGLFSAFPGFLRNKKKIILIQTL